MRDPAGCLFRPRSRTVAATAPHVTVAHTPLRRCPLRSAEAECNRLSKKLDRIKSSGMEKMALKYKELLEKVLNAKVGALKAAADAPGPIEYPKGGFSSRSPLVLDDEGHRSPDPTHQPNPGEEQGQWEAWRVHGVCARASHACQHTSAPLRKAIVHAMLCNFITHSAFSLLPPASAVAAEMLGEIEDAGGPASALMKERAEQTLAARRARSEAQLEIPEDLLDDGEPRMGSHDTGHCTAHGGQLRLPHWASGQLRIARHGFHLHRPPHPLWAPAVTLWSHAVDDTIVKHKQLALSHSCSSYLQIRCPSSPTSSSST